MGFEIRGVVINPGHDSSYIEVNGNLLEEVPDTNGEILSYPGSDVYFLRNDIYKSPTAKDIKPLSGEEVLQICPNATL